ncbi:MAG: VapA/VapB family virulence-associated protein [Candidatus Kapaibacterium sp.]
MEETTVDVQAIATDFATTMQGKLDSETINNVVTSLKTTAQAYPANGSVASFIFYLKFQVSVKNGGKTFNGDAGGLTTPGGGALFGDVYTDDINRLYKDTTAFEFQGTPVYLSILFFDKNSNLLGHFQAGAISTVIGVGGGSGKWS